MFLHLFFDNLAGCSFVNENQRTDYVFREKLLWWRGKDEIAQRNSRLDLLSSGEAVSLAVWS